MFERVTGSYKCNIMGYMRRLVSILKRYPLLDELCRAGANMIITAGLSLCAFCEMILRTKSR